MTKDTCANKIQAILQFVDKKLNKLERDEDIIEYVCKETLDLKKMHDTLVKVHNKECDCAMKANELVISYCNGKQDETVSIGLICLQKDYQKAIDE